jgi:alanyl-tRNA synthetase
MATTRLYYTDSLLPSFEATVVSCAPVADRFEVILDRTAFYPTSGGQPYDTGTLGGARVVDVVDRDDEVVHVIEGPIAQGTVVRGEIDTVRRLDHIQQHTGQHMLSAAFDREARVRTVSFHMGADASTIDLAREVSPAEIAAAEDAANRVIWEDRPITIRFATEEEASRMPLRKEPVKTGRLRLVEVADFDLSACGGTHATRTGMVGLIAVSGWERFKGGSRISFVCGGRALATFRQLRDAAIGVTRELSVAIADMPGAVERLRGDLKSQARALRQLQEQLAVHEAARLRDGAETIGGVRGVLTSTDWDGAAIKALAQAIVAEPNCVAVVTGGGRPVPVVVARSAGVAIDAGAWMQRAVAALGGRGGGRPELAQGGVAAEPDRVLQFARETLLESDSGSRSTKAGH